LTLQADEQAGRSFSRCAYVLDGAVYPVYATGSNTPTYVWLGKLAKAGQRYFYPMQTAGSTFVTDGTMPAYSAGFVSLTIDGGARSLSATSYVGPALNKVFTGNFTVTIVVVGSYLLPSFAWRASVFDPAVAFCYKHSAGFHSSPFAWLNATGISTFAMYWNYAQGASEDTKYLRYERSGNTLTVKWGSSLGAINTSLLSATCNTGDLVGCALASAGYCTHADILSYNGTLA
jgi:hypothetical protein